MREQTFDIHDDDRGSAPAEFVMVGALLTVIVLAVLQIGIVSWVRNVARDAAVDAAFHVALAGSNPADAPAFVAQRMSSVQASGTTETSVHTMTVRGVQTVAVTVRTVMPLLGFIGVPAAMEVTAHAPLQQQG